jgi:hypothetical protein
MIVLVINKKRFLINDKSKAADKHCEDIIKNYPSDATVYFDTVKDIDVQPNKIP